MKKKKKASGGNPNPGGSMSDSMVKRESTRHSLKEDVKQIEREILSPLKINNRGLDDLDSEHNSKVSGDSCAYLSYSKESMSPCELIEDLTQENFSLQRALEASRALAESLAAEYSSLTERFIQQGIVVNQLKSSMEQLQEEIRLQLEYKANLSDDNGAYSPCYTGSVTPSYALSIMDPLDDDLRDPNEGAFVGEAVSFFKKKLRHQAQLEGSDYIMFTQPSYFQIYQFNLKSLKKRFPYVSGSIYVNILESYISAVTKCEKEKEYFVAIRMVAKKYHEKPSEEMRNLIYGRTGIYEIESEFPEHLDGKILYGIKFYVDEILNDRDSKSLTMDEVLEWIDKEEDKVILQIMKGFDRDYVLYGGSA